MKVLAAPSSGVNSGALLLTYSLDLPVGCSADLGPQRGEGGAHGRAGGGAHGRRRPLHRHPPVQDRHLEHTNPSAMQEKTPMCLLMLTLLGGIQEVGFDVTWA